MKLSGIRVLDFSRFMAGPLVSSIMADHGAEVIKIEAPEGDPVRAGRRSRDGQIAGDSFAVLNRGKQSVVLDLKQACDRDAARRLIATADVLVESFSPGVTARLGIDAPSAQRLNPRLVYCSISAFGQHGPLRDTAAHDPAVQALTGILPRDRDGRPVIPTVSVASWCTAHSALAGILMALMTARATGLGDHLDISMHDVALSARPNAAFAALSGNAQTGEMTLGYAMLEPYETADRAWLCLGAGEARFARPLLDALQRPDLIDIALGKPGGAQNPLREFLTQRFRERARVDWLGWLDAHGIPAMPVLDYREALQHPHAEARGMLLTDADGHRHLNTPIRFSREPGTPALQAPMLGEHTQSVLNALNDT
ncbi:CaiB/BaiF CoA transferase family protein [Paraburkholderia humisilvae]|uniref:Acetyl-CoA:oxalate CoA-transferase n=1 Tax=Paraburkholderia humisilvae TaxID=627669 RepID=A0A6J5EB85_9BURK|nr:CoA transferase [Paraburkholderia humisilvae]CAB3762315.1 Acetyl-CoA:oxalate CoA-transferase [Paraburkholderia humisilvae]